MDTRNLIRNLSPRTRAGIAAGIDGAITIVHELPGQAWRTYQAIPASDQKALRQKVGLGMDNYYFGNPQLFKMPGSKKGPDGLSGTQSATSQLAVAAFAIVVVGIMIATGGKKK